MKKEDGSSQPFPGNHLECSGMQHFFKSKILDGKDCAVIAAETPLSSAKDNQNEPSYA